MNPYAWAFLGGLFGAAVMDITEAIAARFGITSGVNVALVGRWAAGLARGRVRHADIRRSPAVPGEVALGWAFHLLAGGAGVALLYPLALHGLGVAPAAHPLSGGLLFGLATSLLPWLVLLPAFGWSWGGHRGPPGANAWVASVVAHGPYGLAVALLLAWGAVP